MIDGLAAVRIACGHGDVQYTLKHVKMGLIQAGVCCGAGCVDGRGT